MPLLNTPILFGGRRSGKNARIEKLMSQMLENVWHEGALVWNTPGNLYFPGNGDRFVYKLEDDMGGDPAEHFGQVRYMRKQFKEYSKEDFRNLSKTPIIKDILTGSCSVPKEEIAARIKQHLTDEP